MISEKLASLFQTDPSAPAQLAVRQGVVQSWDADTGENSIQIAGGTIVNIPSLTAESAELVAGDVVAVLSSGDQALVLGKVTTPGDPGTVPSWTVDISALEAKFPVTTPDIAAAAVTTPKISTAAVTSQTTEFRPGGGMLSNLIPDPEFIDPAWRAQRPAADGWSTWTFGQVPQLAPAALAGYTFGPKVTGTSVAPGGDLIKGSFDVLMTVNTALVATDVLFTSATAGVTGSRVYQAHLNASRDQANLTAEVEWLTSGMVSISTSPVVGSSSPVAVTSPSNAAFARIRFKATGAVPTGSLTANDVALYLGGAGIEPGDWTAAIDFAPSYVGADEIILARNLPISRVQDYYGDLTGFAVNAEAYFLLRQYDANDDLTDGFTSGGPTVTAQPTPAWKGDSGPITAVLKNTVRADLILHAAPITPGQAGRIEFTQPILALTGFTSRDGARRAIHSPKQLQMAGENVAVYIDSDDGLASIHAPVISLGDGTGPGTLAITGNDVTNADVSSLTNTFPTFPYYYAYLNANQSIPTAGTAAKVTGWVADGSPTNSEITHSSGNFTVPRDGRYRLRAQAWWAAVASPTGVRTAQWVKNPTTLIASHTVPGNSATVPMPVYVEKTVRLVAGDQVFLQVIQGQASPHNLIGTTPDITYAQIEWVGP